MRQTTILCVVLAFLATLSSCYGLLDRRGVRFPVKPCGKECLRPANCKCPPIKKPVCQPIKCQPCSKGYKLKVDNRGCQICKCVPDGSKGSFKINRPLRPNRPNQSKRPRRVNRPKLPSRSKRVHRPKLPFRPRKAEGASRPNRPRKAKGASRPNRPRKAKGASRPNRPRKAKGANRPNRPRKVGAKRFKNGWLRVRPFRGQRSSI